MFINALSLGRIVITLVGIRFLMHEIIIYVKMEFISLIFLVQKSSSFLYIYNFPIWALSSDQKIKDSSLEVYIFKFDF